MNGGDRFPSTTIFVSGNLLQDEIELDCDRTSESEEKIAESLTFAKLEESDSRDRRSFGLEAKLEWPMGNID